ncbi:retrovirus-related pol polyprotein from transposon TNT 1-94 [Tanacetum coccineum]
MTTSVSNSSEEDDEEAKDKTYLVAQASSVICLGVDLEPDEWIKDSGCSKHMMGNRKLFLTYKAYNGGNIIFGSNLRGNIICKGTISHGSLKIANVEHVDNLGFNLLSVGQIYDSCVGYIFMKNDSEIVKDGKVIGRGIRKKGLYVMKLGTKPEDKICLATIDENSTLWHRRLGHANMRPIQSLASKELVRNLPKLRFDQHFCDVCKIGKQAHASHKAKNIISMTKFLELLHMDLFGPSAVRSYGGNLYTLVIVDDYSRLESIRILLAYACALDFKIFQIDVKTAFLDGFINDEMILYTPMKTPMSSDAKLTKDEECKSVDSTKYRGMIGSLLYLTTSRPDIMFSVYLCARFQEDPKTSHLEAVKRIFRYIKGTTHLGLWYPVAEPAQKLKVVPSYLVGEVKNYNGAKVN